MTIEQRVAVLEEIFSKLQDYYMSGYSGEEIDALLASAGVPIGITKEYQSVAEMNQDFTGTDVQRGQFVLILTTDTSSEDYGKVYLKGSANWVYVFTLTSLTAIKGPQGPAGKMGAKGADGADGKNFMVLGYYETLSALNAAVPSPGPGDTYGVGTEPPYAFYMYDPTISNWRYVGNLQGPAGPTGGEDNFVRYDAAQNLTDAQKTQARGNINAAPDGGGVMESAIEVTASSASESYDTFCAKLDEVLATMPNFSVKFLRVYPPQYYGRGRDMCALFKHNSDCASVYTIGSYNDAGQGFRMIKWKRYSSDPAGQWDPLEYINPPMQLGVEYRTTERYLGKPVYVRLVNFGALGNATTKSVDVAIENTDKIPVLGGTALEVPLISGAYGGAISGISATRTSAKITISITTTADLSWMQAEVLLGYTKTTD